MADFENEYEIYDEEKDYTDSYDDLEDDYDKDFEAIDVYDQEINEEVVVKPDLTDVDKFLELTPEEKEIDEQETKKLKSEEKISKVLDDIKEDVKESEDAIEEYA